MANEGGSFRSLLLGKQLKDLREAAGFTLDEAGEHINKSGPTVSRYENAHVPINWPVVDALLHYYEVQDADHRAAVIALAKDAWKRGWWDSFNDMAAQRFLDRVWLESRAQAIQQFSLGYVPGLLQTPAYMEALFREDPFMDDAEIERATELRLKRQELLGREQHLDFTAILDESILHRPVGRPGTLGEQLRHLLVIGDRQGVTIRVLPTDAGAYRALSGDFTIFHLGEPFSPFGYIENQAGFQVVEAPDTARMLSTYEHIDRAALTPEESAKLIKAAGKDRHVQRRSLADKQQE
ncbi:helix-turn-helix transcriptional regulator [Longispora sp. K20-0274]|uniref:helix-turn-helix domain-containing protein n=1 Tax=Longispora sp. K20-0274 TaxID=3088255 RepID=UPI00399B4694